MLSQEVLLNRTLIEAVTGKPVCDFSFPFGMPRNLPTAAEKVVRAAGFTEANVIEIVALVAMYSLTNFFNNVFDPEKDFPAVTPAGAI